MEMGGNEGWKKFWEGKHPEVSGGWDGKEEGAVGAEERVKRYDSQEGDEWKERLSCRVEGREYQGVPERKAQAPPSRTQSPAAPMGIGARSQKEQNESFFEKMGNANASRPDSLPPSQGGKYGGFGSAPPPPERSSSQPRNNGTGGDAAMPGLDDFEKNPMGAITQGWGWFASSVTKQAKVVNEGYIKPTAQKVCPPSLPPSLTSLSSFNLRHACVSIHPASKHHPRLTFSRHLHSDRRIRIHSPSPFHSNPSRDKRPNGHQIRSRKLQQIHRRERFFRWWCCCQQSVSRIHGQSCSRR